MTGNWIVPFKGRNTSGPYNQNFLWQDGSLFVMDNHRAALWCWMRTMELTEDHSIFHIDRHYDTLQSQMEEWRKNFPPSWNIDIEEYLNLKYEDPNGLCMSFPLIRWDNYLSIYFELFASSVSDAQFVTHGEGDKPNFPEARHQSIWMLPEHLGYWLDDKCAPWILNIDLDFFFYTREEKGHQMLSDEYIEACCEEVKAKRDSGAVAVTTICLTPSDDLTGGWEPTERLATKICKMLGSEFSLSHK